MCEKLKFDVRCGLIYTPCSDIGGTNARLELWSLEANEFELNFTKVYLSANFCSVEQLLRLFLTESGITIPEDASRDGPGEYHGPIIAACCLAVCGPVEKEEFMCGPVLPEQPPTTWNANARRVEANLGKVIRQVCTYLVVSRLRTNQTRR